MKALIIGRFQPFHNGHLQLIQSLVDEYDEFLIGIGSSQYSYTRENPFSAEERRNMIKQSLHDAGINQFRLVTIPDIHNYPKWVDHVLSIVDDFDVVISNNDLTKQLFSAKGFHVKTTPLFHKQELSGRKIRQRMYEGKSWKMYVPPAVYDIITSINGVQRIQHLT